MFVIVVVCCLFVCLVFFGKIYPEGQRYFFLFGGNERREREREREPRNEVAKRIAGHEAAPPLVSKTR